MNKSAVLMSYMAMAGMFSDMSVYDYPNKPKSKVKGIVNTKRQKCFRSDCDKERRGNQLYCSKECFELDKERLKRK